MKNKGFTLIELLAVIVILAIIALIATPIILGIIKDTKKESDKRSIEMYADALKNAIAQQQLDGSIPITGTFSTDNGKDILLNGEPVFTVDYDGPEISIERIDIYEDGSIYLEDIKSGKDILANSVGTKRYKDGEEVYIDVTTGKSCTNYHEDNSKTGYNGLNGTGNQTSCLKFYAFLDDGSDKINLILDHNTTDKMKVKYYGYAAPSTGFLAIIQLKTDTNGWNGTITPANDTFNHTTGSYTIDYSEYKARLITAQEITKITGSDKLLSWDETSTTSEWYYLDGAKGTDSNWQTQVANSINKSDYYWLFDRTSDCTSYGCQVADSSTYGYWTNSGFASDSFDAWFVSYKGYVHAGRVTSQMDNNFYGWTSSYGVRPVITILKSNM